MKSTQSYDGTSVSFGQRHIATAGVSSKSGRGGTRQVSSDQVSQKDVDLRPEEILDGYCIVMRQANPKLNLNDEYNIYNLLAKLSALVAYQCDLTWSKALEVHFNRNMFKAKSSKVAHSFINRKFFCRWLERYL